MQYCHGCDRPKEGVVRRQLKYGQGEISLCPEDLARLKYLVLTKIKIKRGQKR